VGELRSIAPPFVASGSSGVAVRTRLKQLTPGDEQVLRLVSAHLGSLASKDLRARCRDGLSHSGKTWAVRKRGLTALSSSRWAGSITKATHDQWALARRSQPAHIQNLEAGIRTIEHRLSLPVGQKGTQKAPGGYRSQREWHAKSRRLRVLQDRLAAVRDDREAGVVHVVRGGKGLARTRHHLDEAGLTESEWRKRWEAERWFCQAGGESGNRERRVISFTFRNARSGAFTHIGFTPQPVGFTTCPPLSKSSPKERKEQPPRSMRPFGPCGSAAAGR
jgi:hypothetical protein